MVVLIGPSGVGKGSIAGGVVARVPRLWLSRSWTTRPRRPGEAPDAYRFVDDATFDAHLRAGGFLESATVFDHRYGTPLPEPPAGHDVLLEIDVQGAASVRAARPDAVVVLVVPPSRAVQEARLRGRGEDEATIRRRLAEADREEAEGRALADHVVLNDDLSRATEEVAAIVGRHRERREQAPPA
ncbi:MAG: guanylate kinase [Acidimicrobiales bacterium]